MQWVAIIVKQMLQTKSKACALPLGWHCLALSTLRGFGRSCSLLFWLLCWLTEMEPLFECFLSLSCPRQHLRIRFVISWSNSSTSGDFVLSVLYHDATVWLHSYPRGYFLPFWSSVPGNSRWEKRGDEEDDGEEKHSNAKSQNQRLGNIQGHQRRRTANRRLAQYVS